MSGRLSKLLSLPFMVVLCGANDCDDTPQNRILQELGVKKAVIFNADDLGLSSILNQGIADTWRGADGLITSVSLQTASDEGSLQEALDWLASIPDVDAGVHLTLMVKDVGIPMRPVLDPTEVPALVDENGCFFSSELELFLRMALLPGALKQAESELRAQIEVARLHGIDITHLDSHLDFCAYPTSLSEICLKLAREYDLPIRWWWGWFNPRVTDLGIVVPNLIEIITEPKATADDLERKRQTFIEMLRKLPEGITEVFFHPATQTVANFEWRYLEYLLLNDPEVRTAIDEMVADGELALIGWRELRDMQRSLR